ncbi:hypothetical protein AGMMS49944_11590 [Spirochaetia bacterium]|nr:hypothetical protein AGMMS49944_11590 [Spirochaetia bacterium]
MVTTITIITTAKAAIPGIGAVVMVTTIMGMADDVSLVPRTALLKKIFNFPMLSLVSQQWRRVESSFYPPLY